MTFLTPRDPATGEALASVASVPPAEVPARVKAARAAQASWASLSAAGRASRLKKLRGVIAGQADAFAALISRETGKTRTEALAAEILPSLLWLDYVCREAPGLLKPRRVSSRWLFTHESTVTFHPLGVVGIITPWNFPVYITLSSAAAALAAGNAVITKPSRFTPLCVMKLEEMADEAGLPAGLFQVLPGDASLGEALIDAGVDKIVFTGSTSTGKKIASACAEKLIPFVLEMGGKDPMIVLEDAPMPRTVHGALFGGFCHAGQVCMSVERVYVVETIAKKFLLALSDEALKLRIGSDIGPIQNKDQLSVIERQVDEAVRRGSAVLTGKDRAASGQFFPPTILVDVPEDAEAASRETFGPVMVVRVVKDADEAVALANASPYGLTASVWTADVPRAREIAGRLETGNVYINDHLSPAGNPRAPWGGVKESGLGRQRGEWGIYSMVEARHVARSRFLPDKDFFWFPRTAKQERVAAALIRAFFSSGMKEKLKGMRDLIRGAFS